MPRFRGARFRADPNKVRVSIRREKGQWRVHVESRVTGARSSALGNSPRWTMMSALKRAERMKIEGIDLDMQWVYDHPWGIAS